jgi:hypothetical protein
MDEQDFPCKWYECDCEYICPEMKAYLEDEIILPGTELEGETPDEC